MKTKVIYPDIFLHEFLYEKIGTNNVKILSEQTPENEKYTEFPQLINLDNIETSIEFNLFLIEKFCFNNFSSNKKKRGNEITKLRIISLTTSLTVFLNWLTENNFNWKDEFYIDNEDPINFFKKYLIDRITSEENHISYDSAKLYLNDVKMLYEWAAHNHIIDRLPFEYYTSYYANEQSKKITSRAAPLIQVTSSSISIPKKYKLTKITNDAKRFF